MVDKTDIRFPYVSFSFNVTRWNFNFQWCLVCCPEIHVSICVITTKQSWRKQYVSTKCHLKIRLDETLRPAVLVQKGLQTLAELLWLSCGKMCSIRSVFTEHLKDTSHSSNNSKVEGKSGPVSFKIQNLLLCAVYFITLCKVSYSFILTTVCFVEWMYATNLFSHISPILYNTIL